jgi:hypothetical protein
VLWQQSVWKKVHNNAQKCTCLGAAGVISGGNQRVGLLPRILTAVFAWLETGARQQPGAGGASAPGFEVTAVVDGI